MAGERLPATDTIVYDGFGDITSETSPTNGGNLKFQGMYWDGPVGEYDDKARPYNPSTATFGGMDPDGFGGGSTNLYSFTGNDPTNATDPSGLNEEFRNKTDANPPGASEKPNLPEHQQHR